MTSYKVARRAFLRGAGASALLPLLRHIEARAQGMPAPLRFLVIHNPLGTQHKWTDIPTSTDLWRPAVTATTTNFTLPLVSAPFNPLKPKMVMIDGLNIVTASLTAGGNNGGHNTHEGGVVAVMTGVPTLGPIGQQDHAAGGPSIDQLFLDQSPLLGGANSPSAIMKTQFQYLALAADIRSDRDEVAPRVLSYRPPLPITLPASAAQLNAARQPLFPETAPINIYNRIFGGATGAGDPAAAAAKLAQQESVLDFIRGDLARMRTLVPAAETTKLDAFASAVQQLESSLKLSLGAGGCQKPMTPESFAMTGTGAAGGQAPTGGSQLKGVDYYNPSDPNDHPHQRLGLEQLAMIQAAFQCDFVRVATFMWSAGTNWVVFPSTFQGQTVPLTPAAASTPHHPPSHTTNQATMTWLAQINTWYAQQSSGFIQALDMAKDLDGNSILDNTVVVYVSEIARAFDHDQRNAPVLVFGGKNTRIKGGQYIKIKDGPLQGVDQTTGNRPLNDMWLALAPIFGVNLPSLGSTAQYTGALPGLVG